MEARDFSRVRLHKIDKCCSNPPESISERQSFWDKDFQVAECGNIYEFDMMLGHEIALEIKKARDEGKKLILIVPVGPMGMYRWAVYFLKAWKVSCDHVYGFNMDEWADGRGTASRHMDQNKSEEIERITRIVLEAVQSYVK